MAFFRVFLLVLFYSNFLSIPAVEATRGMASQKGPILPKVDVRFILNSVEEPLKDFPFLDLFRKSQLRHVEQKEPQTGRNVSWTGILLSQLVEQAVLLDPEKSNQIDLLRIESKSGRFIFVPRSLVTKYPILLAYSERPSILPKEVELRLILPASTHPGIYQEGLPIETYWISEIRFIQLTSYEDQFKRFFLKRRTDPLAMRGEKLFIRNCLPCHDSQGSARLHQMENLNAVAKLKRSLKQRELQSLGRYIDLYNQENRIYGLPLDMKKL